MAKANTNLTIHRGPFTAQSRPIAKHRSAHLALGENSPLNDRLLHLSQTRRILSSAQYLPEFQEKLFELAHRNFNYAGKSAVFSGIWRLDKFHALTIPEHLPALPKNASAYVSIGKTPTFPLQAELAQKAIETKDLVLAKTATEEFLAIPLIKEDRIRPFGVLLLSNRLSNGSKGFTETDIAVARTLAEVAAAASAPFLSEALLS